MELLTTGLTAVPYRINRRRAEQTDHMTSRAKHSVKQTHLIYEYRRKNSRGKHCYVNCTKGQWNRCSSLHIQSLTWMLKTVPSHQEKTPMPKSHTWDKWKTRITYNPKHTPLSVTFAHTAHRPLAIIYIYTITTWPHVGNFCTYCHIFSPTNTVRIQGAYLT
jgi:hypothetical protein